MGVTVEITENKQVGINVKTGVRYGRQWWKNEWWVGITGYNSSEGSGKSSNGCYVRLALYTSSSLASNNF